MESYPWPGQCPTAAAATLMDIIHQSRWSIKYNITYFCYFLNKDKNIKIYTKRLKNSTSIQLCHIFGSYLCTDIEVCVSSDDPDHKPYCFVHSQHVEFQVCVAERFEYIQNARRIHNSFITCNNYSTVAFRSKDFKWEDNSRGMWKTK